MAASSSPYNTRSRLAVFEQLPKKEKARPKRPAPKSEDLSESQSSECDLVIDDDEEASQKKRHCGVRLLEEPLILKCLWGECNESFEEYRKFMAHVHAHPFNEYEVELESNVCLWEDCEQTFETIILLIKHLSLHGYHEKLQQIGKNVVSRLNLPNCSQMTRFSIPDQRQDYDCLWKDCDIHCVTYYEFLQHLKLHAHQNPSFCKNNELISCEWELCKYTCNSKYKLAYHIKTHTKEKVAACPTCGNLFATKTKLGDHRKRQLPMQMLSYQCSQCSKLFANERLLRDHMRSHINHYKCSMCDMTCPKPSTLLKHIRHRHLDERPFKCHLCKHASVTKSDLQAHLTTHCAEKLLACEECDFRCRCINTLDRHYHVVHSLDWRNTYECHCCKKKFSRGNILTKHLIKMHDFFWPSGHSRFRYKVDSDGIYRLQTVRYESLEVTQQMMSRKVPEFSENVKIDLKKEPSSGDVTKFVLMLSEDEEKKVLRPVDKEPEDDKKSVCPFSLMVSNDGEENVVCATKNEIEITIDDVDEKGIVIKSETVTSKEILRVPEVTRLISEEK